MIRKHVNLVPFELRPKFEVPHQWAPLILFMVMVLFVGGSALRIQMALTSGREEVTKLLAADTEIKEQIQKNRQLELSNEAFNSLQRVLSKKNYLSEVFQELSLLIPEGIWLTSFTNQKQSGGDAVVLRGESVSQEKVGELLALLEQSQHFSRTRITYSEREPNIRPERYRFEFVVPFRFSNSPPPAAAGAKPVVAGVTNTAPAKDSRAPATEATPVSGGAP